MSGRVQLDDDGCIVARETVPPDPETGFPGGEMYAKIVCDSVCVPTGRRVTSVEVEYPLIIHNEVLTHRDRCRNTASSRAIPYPELRDRTKAKPFFPWKWGAAQRGMQSGGVLPAAVQRECNFYWDMLRNVTYFVTDRLDQLGVHKSITNRPMGWFQYTRCLMTATFWNNFLKLRVHRAAEPHFQVIAKLVRQALLSSRPNALQPGDWHLPYVRLDDLDAGHPTATLVQMSAARSARLSYLTHDRKRDVAADMRLYQTLVTGGTSDEFSPDEDPPHASALEHPCRAMAEPAFSGPFYGWHQHRKDLPNECGDSLDNAYPTQKD